MYIYIYTHTHIYIYIYIYTYYIYIYNTNTNTNSTIIIIITFVLLFYRPVPEGHGPRLGSGGREAGAAPGGLYVCIYIYTYIICTLVNLLCCAMLCYSITHGNVICYDNIYIYIHSLRIIRIYIYIYIHTYM